MSENLLTLQEAATKLGIKPITLRKWDREGKLVAVRVGPRADRKYRESDLKSFLEYSNKKKVAWQEYIRSGVKFHHVGYLFEETGVFRNGIPKYFGRKINHNMAYFEHDTMFWYYVPTELYEVGHFIVDKLLRSRRFEDKYFDDWKIRQDKVTRLIEKNPREKLFLLTSKQLSNFYIELNNVMLDWYGLSMIIDMTDESLMTDVTQSIRDILKKKLGDSYTEKEFIRVYNILTLPSRLSYLNDERRMTLELARDYDDLSPDQKNKRIDALLRQFWWTSLGWIRTAAKSEKDIVREIESINSSKTDIHIELDEIRTYEDRTVLMKKKIDDKYRFSKNKLLSEYLRLLDRLFVYHDIRKEIQMKENFYEYKVLDVISKKTGVPGNLLEWCSSNEIVQILRQRKYDETELNNRASRFLVMASDDEFTMASGKPAESRHNNILGHQKEDIRDLQGTTACPGKVIAEAYVAITVDMAMKIKEGSVLVTGMTTPDFVPAMKKASAIVTDEGGITCHAAIVSRELHKPCIVGTKSATRTIHTGDMIEVSANHGVVRILKRVDMKDDDKRK